VLLLRGGCMRDWDVVGLGSFQLVSDHDMFTQLPAREE